MFSTSNVSFSVSSSALNVLEEVAVTISPMDSQIIVWNIRTGAVLRNFKNTSSKTCAFLQNSYLLCPQKDKPQIFSYSWERVLLFFFFIYLFIYFFLKLHLHTFELNKNLH